MKDLPETPTVTFNIDTWAYIARNRTLQCQRLYSAIKKWIVFTIVHIILFILLRLNYGGTEVTCATFFLKCTSLFYLVPTRY